MSSNQAAAAAVTAATGNDSGSGADTTHQQQQQPTLEVIVARLSDANLVLSVKAAVLEELQGTFDQMLTTEAARITTQLLPALLALLQGTSPSLSATSAEHLVRSRIFDILGRAIRNLPNMLQQGQQQLVRAIISAFLAAIECNTASSSTGDSEEVVLACLRGLTDSQRHYKSELAEMMAQIVNVAVVVFGRFERAVRLVLSSAAEGTNSAAASGSGGTPAASSILGVTSPRPMSPPATGASAGANQADSGDGKQLPSARDSIKVVLEFCTVFFTFQIQVRRLMPAEVEQTASTIVSALTVPIQIAGETPISAADLGPHTADSIITVPANLRCRAVVYEVRGVQIKMMLLLSQLVMIATNPFKLYSGTFPSILLTLFKQCPSDPPTSRRDIVTALGFIRKSELRQPLVDRIGDFFDVDIIAGSGISSQEVSAHTCFSLLCEIVYGLRHELTAAQLQRVIVFYRDAMCRGYMDNQMLMVHIRVMNELIEPVMNLSDKQAAAWMLVYLMMTMLDRLAFLRTTLVNALSGEDRLFTKRFMPQSTAAISATTATTSTTAAAAGSESESTSAAIVSPGTTVANASDSTNSKLHIPAFVHSVNSYELTASPYLIHGPVRLTNTMVRPQRSQSMAFHTAMIAHLCNLFPVFNQLANAMKAVAAALNESGIDLATTALEPYRMVELVSRLFKDGLAALSAVIQIHAEIQPQHSNSQSTTNNTAANDKKDSNALEEDEMKGMNKVQRAQYKRLKSFPYQHCEPTTPADLVEVIDKFADVIISIDLSTLQEVMHLHIDTLLAATHASPPLFHFSSLLALRDVGVSQIFAAVLSKYIVPRLEDLGAMSAYDSCLMLSFFRTLLRAVIEYQQSNEPILQPHIVRIIMSALSRLRATPRPMPHLMVLRMACHSIGDDRCREMYREASSLIHFMFAELNAAYDVLTDKSALALLTDTTLAVPVRLSEIINHMTLMMRPILYSLYASPELAERGLRALEICVDNLNVDHLNPILAPAMGDLLPGIWRHVRPPPYDSRCAITAVKLFGKLGGFAQSHLRDTFVMSHIYDDFGGNPMMANVNSSSGAALHQQQLQQHDIRPAAQIRVEFEDLHQKPIVTLDPPVRAAIRTARDYYNGIEVHTKTAAVDFLFAQIAMYVKDAPSDTSARRLAALSADASAVLLSTHTASGGSGAKQSGTGTSSGAGSSAGSGSGSGSMRPHEILIKESLLAILEAVATDDTELRNHIVSKLRPVISFFAVQVVAHIRCPPSSSSVPDVDINGVETLNPHLIVDVFSDSLMCPHPTVYKTASEMATWFLDCLRSLIPDPLARSQLGIFDLLVRRSISDVYRPSIHARRAGLTGLELLLGKGTPSLDDGTSSPLLHIEWVRNHELPLIRALFHVLKNLNVPAAAAKAMANEMDIVDESECSDGADAVQCKRANRLLKAIIEICHDQLEPAVPLETNADTAAAGGGAGTATSPDDAMDIVEENTATETTATETATEKKTEQVKSEAEEKEQSTSEPMDVESTEPAVSGETSTSDTTVATDAVGDTAAEVTTPAVPADKPETMPEPKPEPQSEPDPEPEPEPEAELPMPAGLDLLALRPLILLLGGELSSSSSQVRRAVQSLFVQLAARLSISVAQLLKPFADKILYPIFTKPLRTLAFSAQIGHLDALRFCMSEQPPTIISNLDDLLRMLNEATVLADTDDKALVMREVIPPDDECIAEFRLVCIQLLQVATLKLLDTTTPLRTASSGSSAESLAANLTSMRGRVVTIFLKSLHLSSPDIVAAAQAGLRAIYPDNTRMKWPKEQLQNGLRPILQNLSNARNLTPASIEGLGRLLSILANFFRPLIGPRMLNHLTGISEMGTIAQATLLDNHELQVAVSITRVAHLIQTSATLLPTLVQNVLVLEGQLKRHRSSPFREPMSLLTNQHPEETVAYFLEKLNDTSHARLFAALLEMPSASGVRAALLKRHADLTKFIGEYAQTLTAASTDSSNAPNDAAMQTTCNALEVLAAALSAGKPAEFGARLVHSENSYALGDRTGLAPKPKSATEAASSSEEMQAAAWLIDANNSAVLSSLCSIVASPLWISTLQRKDACCTVARHFLDLAVSLLMHCVTHEDAPYSAVAALAQLCERPILASVSVLRRHLWQNVALSPSVAKRQRIVQGALDQLAAASQTSLIGMFRYAVVPCFYAEYSRKASSSPPVSSPSSTPATPASSTEIFAGSAIVQRIENVIWKPLLGANSGDPRCSERLSLELVRLSILVVRNELPRQADTLRAAFRYITQLFKHDDTIIRHASFVLCAHFVAVSSASPNAIAVLVSNLLRAPQNDLRHLLFEAGDVLFPVLPERLPPPAGQPWSRAQWIQMVNGAIEERGATANQNRLLHVLSAMARYSDVFYPASAVLMPHLPNYILYMLRSMTAAGVNPNTQTTQEYRQLLCDLLTMMVRWEAMARGVMEVADELAPKKSELQLRLTAVNRKTMADDAARVERGGQSLIKLPQPLPLLFRERMLVFFNRLYINITDSDAERTRATVAANENPAVTAALEVDAAIMDVDSHSSRLFNAMRLAISPGLWPDVTMRFQLPDPTRTLSDAETIKLCNVLFVVERLLEVKGKQWLSPMAEYFVTFLRQCVKCDSQRIHERTVPIIERVGELVTSAGQSSQVAGSSSNNSGDAMDIDESAQEQSSGDDSAATSDAALVEMINGLFNELETIVCDSLTNPTPSFGGMTQILRALSKYRPTAIDKCAPALVSLMQKLAKEVQSAQQLIAQLQPRLQHRPQDAAAIAEATDTVRKALDLMKPIMEMLRERVSFLGDHRRYYLAALVRIVEASTNMELMGNILDTIEGWIKSGSSSAASTTAATASATASTSSGTTSSASSTSGRRANTSLPTIREKATLMCALMMLRTNADQKLIDQYLRLVLYAYTEPSLARTDLTVRLEQAFLLGMRAKDPQIRSEFLSLLDSSLPRSLRHRLSYVIGTQNWESVSQEFWIAQALALLLRSVRSSQSEAGAVPVPAHISAANVVSTQGLVTGTGSLAGFGVCRQFANLPVLNAPSSSALIEALAEVSASATQFVASTMSTTASGILRSLEQLVLCDDRVAHVAWIEVFASCWNSLRPRDATDAAPGLIALLAKPYHNAQEKQRPNVIQALFDGILRCRPIPMLPPHLIRTLGQKFGAHHQAILMLETYAAAPHTYGPTSSRLSSIIGDALSTIYDTLGDRDMSCGLLRQHTQFVETNIALSHEQYGQWAPAQTAYERAQIMARTGALPYVETEFELWEQRWMGLLRRMQQWDVVAELSKTAGDAPRLLDSIWHMWDRWFDNLENIERLLMTHRDTATPRLRICQMLFYIMTQPDTSGELTAGSDGARVVGDLQQLLLNQWHQMPSIVTSNSHQRLIYDFQMCTEVLEATGILKRAADIDTNNLESMSGRIKVDLQNWRDRLPLDHTDFEIWSDIVAWRRHIFTEITRRYENAGILPRAGAANAGGNSSTASHQYRGPHEVAWISNRFARIARKHGLVKLCKDELAKVYRLPNIEVHEAFLKLYREAKCSLDTPYQLNAGLDVISNTNLMYFSAAQKSDFFKLKGIFLSRLGRLGEANDSFSMAVQVDTGCTNAWAAWATYNDARSTMSASTTGQIDYGAAAGAVCSYLQAASDPAATTTTPPGIAAVAAAAGGNGPAGSGSNAAGAGSINPTGAAHPPILLKSGNKHVRYLARVLFLLSIDNDAGTISEGIEAFRTSPPYRAWLMLVPQLLVALGHREAQYIRPILQGLVQQFPQEMFFQLRSAKEEYLGLRRPRPGSLPLSSSGGSHMALSSFTGSSAVAASESGAADGSQEKQDDSMDIDEPSAESKDASEKPTTTAAQSSDAEIDQDSDMIEDSLDGFGPGGVQMASEHEPMDTDDDGAGLAVSVRSQQRQRAAANQSQQSTQPEGHAANTVLSNATLSEGTVGGGQNTQQTVSTQPLANDLPSPYSQQYSLPGVTNIGDVWGHVDTLYEALRSKVPLLVMMLKSIADQLSSTMRLSMDEEMHRVLSAVIPESMAAAATRLIAGNDSPVNIAQEDRNLARMISNLSSDEVRAAFERDFYSSPMTRLECVRKLCRWREHYARKMAATPRTIPLNELSHFLSELQHAKFDDVLMPGEYMRNCGSIPSLSAHASALAGSSNSNVLNSALSCSFTAGASYAAACGDMYSASAAAAAAATNAGLHSTNAPPRIDRFLPDVQVVHRHTGSMRRVGIRSTTGNVRYFNVQYVLVRYARREERMFQMLSILNGVLGKRVETAQRGVCFTTPAVVPLTCTMRLIGEDPSEITLHDIYGQHLTAAGFAGHSYAPLLFYLDELRTFGRTAGVLGGGGGSGGSGGTSSSSSSAAATAAAIAGRNTELTNLRMDIVDQISTRFCPDSVITEYFARSLRTPSDYWCFRREFTSQLGIGALMSFAFLFNQRAPHKFGIAKSNAALTMFDLFMANIPGQPFLGTTSSSSSPSGPFNLNDPALIPAGSTTSSSSVLQSSGNASSYIDDEVPFRLTPNLQHFITKVGMAGPFSSAIVSLARALTKRGDTAELEGLLQLFLRDELLLWLANAKRTTNDPRRIFEIVCANSDVITRRVAMMACRGTNSPATATGLAPNAGDPSVQFTGGITGAPGGPASRTSSAATSAATGAAASGEDQNPLRNLAAQPSHSDTPVDQPVIDLMRHAVNPMSLANMGMQWLPWF